MYAFFYKKPKLCIVDLSHCAKLMCRTYWTGWRCPEKLFHETFFYLHKFRRKNVFYRCCKLLCSLFEEKKHTMITVARGQCQHYTYSLNKKREHKNWSTYILYFTFDQQVKRKKPSSRFKVSDNSMFFFKAIFYLNKNRQLFIRVISA